MYNLVELDAYAKGSEKHLIAARAGAEKRSKEACRTVEEHKRLRAHLNAGYKRNEKKADNFDQLSQAAGADIKMPLDMPQAWGLENITTSSYTIGDMATTLAERERRRDPTTDVVSRERELKKKDGDLAPAKALRVKMVREFFGTGWESRWAPRNMPTADQDDAVEKAKMMSTDELIESDEWWARRV